MRTTRHFILLAAALFTSGAAWAECRCSDGTTFPVNGDCRDGSLCRIVAPEVTRFGEEAAQPRQAPAPATPVQDAAATRQAAERKGAASFCASAAKHADQEFMYRCNDGSIREDNNCPDGNMGHLFSPKSITCKKHDARRPGRIALGEFMGAWQMDVPGSYSVVDDHINHVRITRIAHGSGTVGTLVIRQNGTYTWNGKRGTWRETADDVNPITLYNGPDGHDWQVSILENWYGLLAVSDARDPGIYYHGQR